MEHFIPAGDSVVLVAKILKLRQWPLVEYPVSALVPHGRSEERWSVDNGSVAAVRYGVVRGLMPGVAHVTVRIREFVREETIRITLPLDSVVLRFATRDAMVGDTVELHYREYFADGAELPGLGIQWEAMRRDSSGNPPIDRVYLRRGIGEEPYDTILFRALRPGTWDVVTFRYGRTNRDSLVVRPLGERAPRAFRSRWSGPQPPRAGRRPHGCYTLRFGAWLPHTERMGFLPTAVELDSSFILPSAPRFGRRINAARGDRIDLHRSWDFVPGSDTVTLSFHTREGFLPKVDVRVAVTLSGDSLAGSASTGYETASVRGTRVPC